MVILSLFAVAAAIIGTRLHAQKEIGTLQQQVGNLQEQVKQLQEVHGKLLEQVTEQNRQIQELKQRLRALRQISEAERMAAEGNIRGAIVQQCVLTEFFILKTKEIRREDLESVEQDFLKRCLVIFDRPASVTKDDYRTLKAYIQPRYAANIECLRSPDYVGALRRLEKLDVE